MIEFCIILHIIYAWKASVCSTEKEEMVHLHVAEDVSKCIKVFTADGKYIRQYGGGQLQRPAGVTVDQDGYCLVANRSRNALCIFDPQGHFIHSVPTPGSACGVTLDKEGFVYLVENSSSYMYKY